MNDDGTDKKRECSKWGDKERKWKKFNERKKKQDWDGLDMIRMSEERVPKAGYNKGIRGRAR